MCFEYEEYLYDVDNSYSYDEWANGPDDIAPVYDEYSNESYFETDYNSYDEYEE